MKLLENEDSWGHPSVPSPLPASSSKTRGVGINFKLLKFKKAQSPLQDNLCHELIREAINCEVWDGFRGEKEDFFQRHMHGKIRRGRWMEHSISYVYLSVYSIRPSFQIRSMRFGVVIQWASAFLELRKKVSGIQIFPTMLLFRRRTFIVLLNFKRLSYQVWAKKMSMVYSWGQGKKKKNVLCNFKIRSPPPAACWESSQTEPSPALSCKTPGDQIETGAAKAFYSFCLMGTFHCR